MTIVSRGIKVSRVEHDIVTRATICAIEGESGSFLSNLGLFSRISLSYVINI